MTKTVQNLWSCFEIERPPFCISFRPVTSIKGMSTATCTCARAFLLYHQNTCIFSISSKLVKNLLSKLHLPWIMAEIEPYSIELVWVFLFSESEEDDFKVSQDKRRKGNTSWCVCQCCANWEEQREKVCLCCKKIEKVANEVNLPYGPRRRN